MVRLEFDRAGLEVLSIDEVAQDLDQGPDRIRQAGSSRTKGFPCELVHPGRAHPGRAKNRGSHLDFRLRI